MLKNKDCIFTCWWELSSINQLNKNSNLYQKTSLARSRKQRLPWPFRFHCHKQGAECPRLLPFVIWRQNNNSNTVNTLIHHASEIYIIKSPNLISNAMRNSRKLWAFINVKRSQTGILSQFKIHKHKKISTLNTKINTIFHLKRSTIQLVEIIRSNWLGLESRAEDLK